MELKKKVTLVVLLFFIVIFSLIIFFIKFDNKASKADYRYIVCESEKISFENNTLNTRKVALSEGHKKEGIEYSYEKAGVVKENNIALTWSYNLKVKTDKSIPSYKIWDTDSFYTYIYEINEENEKVESERKVNIKNLIQSKSQNYQPVALVDKIEVNGEACYVIYATDKEAKITEEDDGYRWFAISFKDDQIKKIFTTRKEYNEQAKILDIDK